MERPTNAIVRTGQFKLTHYPLCDGIETTWAAHEAGVRFHCGTCRQALSANEFREKTSEVIQAQRAQLAVLGAEGKRLTYKQPASPR